MYPPFCLPVVGRSCVLIDFMLLAFFIVIMLLSFLIIVLLLSFLILTWSGGVVNDGGRWAWGATASWV